MPPKRYEIFKKGNPAIPPIDFEITVNLGQGEDECRAYAIHNAINFCNSQLEGLDESYKQYFRSSANQQGNELGPIVLPLPEDQLKTYHIVDVSCEVLFKSIFSESSIAEFLTNYYELFDSEFYSRNHAINIFIVRSCYKSRTQCIRELEVQEEKERQEAERVRLNQPEVESKKSEFSDLSTHFIPIIYHKRLNKAYLLETLENTRNNNILAGIILFKIISFITYDDNNVPIRTYETIRTPPTFRYITDQGFNYPISLGDIATDPSYSFISKVSNDLSKIKGASEEIISITLKSDYHRNLLLAEKKAMEEVIEARRTRDEQLFEVEGSEENPIQVSEIEKSIAESLLRRQENKVKARFKDRPIDLLSTASTQVSEVSEEYTGLKKTLSELEGDNRNISSRIRIDAINRDLQSKFKDNSNYIIDNAQLEELSKKRSKEVDKGFKTTLRWRESDIKKPSIGLEHYQKSASEKLYLMECLSHAYRQYIIFSEVSSRPKYLCMVEPSFLQIIDIIKKLYMRPQITSKNQLKILSEIERFTPDEFYVIKEGDVLVSYVREYTTCSKATKVQESFKQKTEAYLEFISAINVIFQVSIKYQIYVYCKENSTSYESNIGFHKRCHDPLMKSIEYAIDTLDNSFKGSSDYIKYNAAVSAQLLKRRQRHSSMSPPIFFPPYSFYREISSAYIPTQMKLEKLMKSFIGKELEFNKYSKLNEANQPDNWRDKYLESEDLDDIVIDEFVKWQSKPDYIANTSSVKEIQESISNLKKSIKSRYKITNRCKRSLLMPLYEASKVYSSEEVGIYLDRSPVYSVRRKYVAFVFNELALLDFRSLKIPGIEDEGYDFKTGKKLFLDSDRKKSILIKGNILLMKDNYETRDFQDEYRDYSKDTKHENDIRDKYTKNCLDLNESAEKSMMRFKSLMKEHRNTELPTEYLEEYFTHDAYLRDHQTLSIANIKEFVELGCKSYNYDYTFKCSEIMKSINNHMTRRCKYNEVSVFNRGIKNLWVIMAEGDSSIRVSESRPMIFVSVVKRLQLDIMIESKLFLDFEYFQIENTDDYIVITNWFRLKSEKCSSYTDAILRCLSCSYRTYLGSNSLISPELLKDSLRELFFNVSMFALNCSSSLTYILKEFQHAGMISRASYFPLTKYLLDKQKLVAKSQIDRYAFQKLFEHIINSKLSKNLTKTVDEDEDSDDEELEVDEIERNSGGNVYMKSYLTNSYTQRFEEFLMANYIVHVTTRSTTEHIHIVSKGSSQLAEFQIKFEKELENPGIKFANSTDPKEFRQNIRYIMKSDFMFGYNEYLLRKSMRLLILKHFAHKETEIIAALSNLNLFNSSISKLATTKGMINDNRTSKKIIEKKDKLPSDKTPVVTGGRSLDEDKELIEEFMREKAVVHILRLMKIKPDMTIAELIEKLTSDSAILQIYEMHYREQYGPDREMYIQNLLTRTINNVIESCMSIFCEYIPNEFQTISGKQKNLVMQEQNRIIYGKLKKMNKSDNYKIYFINGDATKWSLSDIIETMTICVDELREYLTESLSDMIIMSLKAMKFKVLRLSRQEQSLLYEIKIGSKPIISQAVEYMLDKASDDLRELTTSVGWFQGILNKLSGLKHAATSELFEKLARRLVEEGYLSEFEYESLVHSDDWNLILLCRVKDARMIYALIKFCKAIANIKDSSKKTNMDDFVREFISDYSVNLGTEEPFIKYICTMTFTPSINGYESDLLEAVSKITSHSDRGSCSIFDDFMLRMANYVTSDVYSMRRGQYNDPTSIFKIARDLIPIELGGVCYEESNSLTNIGARCSNLRISYHPDGKKLMNKLITVGKYLLINSEAFRDDYIYSNTLIAITSSYSKIIKSLRTEFPLSLADIEKLKKGELRIEDLAMPDFPDKKVNYMIKRFHTVSYAKAFENSNLAKQALKLALSTKQAIVTIGSDRHSYRSAFNLVNSLYEISPLKLEYDEEEIKDLILLKNSNSIIWHDLRKRLMFPSLQENSKSLSYISVRPYTSNLSLINETSRIIMYGKYGTEFLSEKGFRIKSIASVEADIESIKRILGDNFLEIPELELYKILNGLQYGKGIVRSAGRIRSYSDYFKSLYTFNIYPYKMAKGDTHTRNKKILLRSDDLLGQSDDDLKSIIVRCSNYINANIISRKYDKISIRNTLETSCLGLESFNSIFNRLTTQDYQRIFRESDLPVIYATYSYLGYDLSELGKIISGMNISGSLSNIDQSLKLAVEDECTDEDSVIIRLKKTKKEVPSYIMLRLIDYTMLCRNDSEELFLELHITDTLSTLNKDRIDVLIRNLFRIVKRDIPDEYTNMLDILSSEDYIKADSTHDYLSDRKNYYFIDRDSKTLTSNANVKKIVPGIRVKVSRKDHLYQSSSLQTILRNNSILGGCKSSSGNSSAPSVDIVDNRGANMDYVIGERTMAVRAINDRKLKKIEGRLTFGGINYFRIDIATINEIVSKNILENPAHFSMIVPEDLMEDIATHLLKELENKGFNKEKASAYISRGNEHCKSYLEKIYARGVLRVQKEIKERRDKLKGNLDIKDDISSAPSASVGDIPNLFDLANMDFGDLDILVDNIEIDDTDDYEFNDDEIVRLMNNNAKSNTLRKLLYRVTSQNFAFCLFRSAISRRVLHDGLLINDLKSFNKFATKIILEDSYDVQLESIKLFMIVFIHDQEEFFKRKGKINWSAVKRELLNQETERYRRIDFEVLSSFVVLPEDLIQYESDSEDDLESDESISSHDDSDLESDYSELRGDWAYDSDAEDDR